MSNPTFSKCGILKEIKVIREFIAQCPAAKCSALRLLAKGGWLLLLLSVPLLASCIRDQLDDCPPLRVEIGVKDKNYFNVDKVDMEEQRSDSLAFRQYVPTLFYMLRDAATGDVVEEQGVFPVEGDGKTVPVDFCPCLPHGKYILTVWGGLDDLSQLSPDHLSLELHRDRQQGGDVYLVSDTLLYDAYNYDYRVELERTKGKLIVQAENLPGYYNLVDIDVSGIYGKVNSNFKYSGETDVWSKTTIPFEPKVRTEMFLAPSVKERGSVLDVSFNKQTSETEDKPLSPDDVSITMLRNEITVLRYVWDADKNGFTVYMLVNDNWELVHGMEID